MLIRDSATVGAWVVLALFCANSATAHNSRFSDTDALPSCFSVSEDPDGDGFGWVASHQLFPHSCEVTDRTHTRPEQVVVGGDSRSIDAIRSYWNPNADIANREIECTDSVWSDSESAYQPQTTFTVKHQLLPDTAPFMSRYEITAMLTYEDLAVSAPWRAANGEYFGDPYYVNPERKLQMFANSWAEQVTVSGIQGMRFWPDSFFDEVDQTRKIDGRRTQECFDKSGQPFGPTGHWDTPPTQSGISIPQIVESSAIGEPPTIVDAETGETIAVQEAVWNLTDDLFGKWISCRDFDWNGYYYDSFHFEWNLYLFMPPLPGAPADTGEYYYNSRSLGPTYRRTWVLQEGLLTRWVHENLQVKFFGSQWYEPLRNDDVTDDATGVRVWSEAGNTKEECYVVEGSERYDLIPTGFMAQTTPESPETTQPTDGSDQTESESSNPDTPADGSDQTESESNDPDAPADGSDQTESESNNPDSSVDTDADPTATGDTNPDTASQTSDSNQGGGGPFDLRLLLLAVMLLRPGTRRL